MSSSQIYFIDSGILREPTSQNSTNKDDINDITRKYLLEQLLYLPCGTCSMDHFLLSYHNALTQALVNESDFINEIPQIINSSLIEISNEKVINHTRESKETLANMLKMSLGSFCEPKFEELIEESKERPLSWNPTIRNSILKSKQ